jgi:hypothetical protein
MAIALTFLGLLGLRGKCLYLSFVDLLPCLIFDAKLLLFHFISESSSTLLNHMGRIIDVLVGPYDIRSSQLALVLVGQFLVAGLFLGGNCWLDDIVETLEPKVDHHASD